MSFFAELKRRNVIRVGIAYAVTAWLVMQFSDVVLNNIEAPGWVFQAIMLVLAIGFPLILIFAWAFEMTPEGIKKEKDVDRSQSITPKTGRKLDRAIIGILTVVVAYLLIDKLVLKDEPTAVERPQVVATEAEPAVETKPSVAVLPFVNMSGDQENEYFSDGLTETLLHMLAQLPDLHVAARTSSFAFKGQNTAVEEIATTLGVAHILEGSVQKSGERVRITSQLIRADDGFHVWSQNYTRPLDDIFAIQDEIASDVADALGASLLGTETAELHAVNTTDLDAYDSYLKGLQQQAIFSYSSLEVAENHFKQALARDPAFTDARLALVRNYMLKNSTGLITRDELPERVSPLISQVREQQPDNRLARAFEIASSLQNFDLGRNRDEIEAEVNELRNLLPLLPDESLIREFVAMYLTGYFKQPQQAIEVIQAGLLVDPLEAELYAALGNIYRGEGQLDQAREALQRAMELAPENPNNYSYLAELEKDGNNLPAALEWHRKSTEVDPQDHELASHIAEDLYALGLPEEGDRWLARVKALVPGSPIQQKLEIQRAVARNETDLAITLAEKVISAQVEDRRNAFAYPVFTYSHLMADSGRARQAYDFLVSVRPKIADYSILPNNFQGILMQYASIMLMTGFESFEARKQAGQQLIGNFDARGIPWRDNRNNMLVDHYIFMGDNPSAIDNYLNDRLSLPMATGLRRHQRQFKSFYAPLYEDPGVAARLTQLDTEFAQLREQISELMQEPEWNQ